MFNRRFYVLFTLLLLLMAFGLYAVRSDHVFNSLHNTDVFRAYEEEEAETSTSFEIQRKQTQEKFLILYDDSDETSEVIKQNIERVLSYMKKEFAAYSSTDFDGDFSEYSSIIIDFDKYDNFDYFDSLFEYVENGGNLIVAQSPYGDEKFNEIYRKFGIYEKGDSRVTKGMKLTTNLMIKAKGLHKKEGAATSAIQLQLQGDCNIQCVSNDGIPLIWSRKLGKGKILFANGQFLSEKENRGLFVGMVSQTGDAFIYPIINTKLNYIDDFPAPIPSGYNDSVYKEYGKNVENFFKDIWWPDMLKTAAKYNVKYSGFVIETYNDKVADFKDEKFPDNRNYLITFGRELLQSGGELGIHGYNHQSLALEGYIRQELGYKSWKSVEDMNKATIHVKQFIDQVYSNYKIRAYVPPSNILSPEGREAIIDALPDLKIISSVYIGGVEKDPYVQEFESSEDGMLELPRLSYGYDMSEFNKWIIYSGLTTHGIFSHFVHPDDVLDSRRNYGQGWLELYKDYNSMMKEVYNNFSWLRSMKVSEGGVELSRFEDVEVHFRQEKGRIEGYCKNLKNEQYFILRTENDLKKAEGCTYEVIDENIYLIKVEKPEFSLEMEDAL